MNELVITFNAGGIFLAIVVVIAGAIVIAAGFRK
jgi:hypothetical protein